ncbi:periplasmic multidrug efflux lipoprotein precursor [Raoultella terrigena]|uniref:Periplasmic multidrug efflux lipoprotein n=1 Tax=Raoultella terrigena TaxID=577 RepID=A0A4V6J2N4_RAOTE|nr:periplasmic multidrug efflux lipoprotein precursor [Raoultella terrigena]
MLQVQFAPLAVCLLPLALVACGDSSGTDDPRTQPPLVRSATVMSAVDVSRAFTGVVVARVQSDLGFRVQGKILERLVDTGQTVKRGQPLMRLDPVDLSLQAQAQQQAVTAARARAKQATADEARYRGLVATGAVSASAYDQIKAAADTAKAELSAAQAQANVAQNATGYAVLLADADGVVMDTLAEPGQVVAPVRRWFAWPEQASARPSCSCQRRYVRRRKRGHGNAVRHGTNSRFRQSCASFPMPRTPSPVPSKRDTCLKGRWRGAPLGSTVTLHIADDKLPGQVMQVPLAAIYDPGKGRGLGDFRSARQSLVAACAGAGIGVMMWRRSR